MNKDYPSAPVERGVRPPDDITEWWRKLLSDHTANGISDANNGVFEWPYPDDSNDPQSEDENLAYKNGFDNRRRELGDSFKWV